MIFQGRNWVLLAFASSCLSIGCSQPAGVVRIQANSGSGAAKSGSQQESDGYQVTSSTSASGTTSSQSQVGPGKSMLWAYYSGFSRCYKWFADPDDPGKDTKPPVTDETLSDTGGCPLETSRPQATCKYTTASDPSPEFYVQSVNWDTTSSYRLDSTVPSVDSSGKKTYPVGFLFRQDKSTEVTSFRLYSNGQNPDFCSEHQRELSLTFYETPKCNQFLQNGSTPYLLSDMTKFLLNFEHKTTVKGTICAPDSKGNLEISIFKPSLLFDLYDSMGSIVAQYAIVFQSRISPKGRAISPDYPEVMNQNDCVNKEFPDKVNCTVQVDPTVKDSGVKLTAMSDGFESFQVDAMPLIKRYFDAGFFRSVDVDGNGKADWQDMMRAQIRTVQLIATQTGGYVDAQVRKVNVRISR